MKLKCFEATDSNGTELYLFPVEDNYFISVPKDQLEFKPLSPKELEEMKGVDSVEDNYFISVPKDRLEFKPLLPKESKEMKGADTNGEVDNH